MTLIAELNSTVNPVFIGDIAESRPTENIIPWPTIGCSSEVFPRGSGYSISGYTQKISIICDRLVICWAGSKIHARLVEGGLKEALIKEQSIQAVLNALNNLSEDLSGEISLIGCFLEDLGPGKSNIHRFQIAAKLYESNQFGACLVSGCGESLLVHQLEAHAAHQPDEFEFLNKEQDAIHKALSITTALLYEEYTNKQPLLFFTGGCYEIAYISNGRFKKLDSHATAIWSVEIDHLGNARDLRLHELSACGYHNEILAVSHVRKSRPSAQGAEIEHFDHFLVAPLSREVTEVERQTFYPILTPEYFSHIVEIHYPEGVIRKLRVTEYFNAQVLRFIDRNGLIGLDVNKGPLLEQIMIFVSN
ncbi:conserved hypothetical protein [Pseudomonas sp. 8Z]|uniref:hypothetical protein n=1 Tax=Pseudomonas sp. 8Z TaxID=2653166 RepID=UPI0012F11F79|nr:hypothetical protein [Pseudomonas sp. 8Z]VXC21360.1 conserved hypothetical protein [Pseudomonas sp. 8Z]